MSLSFLSIDHFRCFTSYQTHLHPRFNYIVGQNGSGKTAFLEAISFICNAHSFRVREITPLIHTAASEFVLHARLQSEGTIGIKKTRQSHTTVTLNGQPCYRTSELATLLPSQVIYQDIFQIVDAGPMIRRQLLDWGVFHVKHSYHEWWRSYRQALKQRNVLLKQNAATSAFSGWDHLLNELASKMDAARIEYIEALNPLFQKQLNQLSEFTCQLSYYDGWNKSNEKKSLATVLKENFTTDKIRQYTQLGPHHADIEIDTEKGKIKQYLSRGQQKMVILALKLAQAQLLNKPCIYLWDDICAELDENHLKKLGGMLQEMPGQFFITGIEAHKTPLFECNVGEVFLMGIPPSRCEGVEPCMMKKN